jgi:hypothetical protein
MTDEVMPRIFRDCAKRVIQQFHYVATNHPNFAGLRVAQVIGFTDNYVQVQFEDGTQENRFGMQVAIL